MFENIFSVENLFLIGFVLIWVLIAIIQDFRKREVANWWNFSFVIFVLAYRGFVSIGQGDYRYFMWGVIGLLIGLGLANLFYYMRLFAGGDAKLLIGLSVALPMSFDLKINLFIFALFVGLFILGGGIYGLFYSIFVVCMNWKKFKKEFVLQFKKYIKLILFSSVVSIFLIVFGFLSVELFFWFGILIFISPLLLIYGKSIELSCMNRFVDVKNLTIGDWIVEEVKVGRKKIKPNWEGLSEGELGIIQKGYKKKILVKVGIPFTPSFLLGFVALLVMFKYGGLFGIL